MGKNSKSAGAALGGAAAGFQVAGPYGAIGGALLGGIAGNNIDGASPEQVQQLDPAFVNKLYNQSMGTEQTAADAKMKASFNQTLAQQIAAARASRGVNPGLLQRNVSRIGAEQNAKSAEIGAEQNIKAQDDARARYLQAIGMNQQAQAVNAKNQIGADDRDQKSYGALLNGIGAIGETYATANASDKKHKQSMELAGALRGQGSATSSTGANPYSLGAFDSLNVPQYDLGSRSDRNSKTNIKKITSKAKDDLVVTSDERQKDLIKNESLPTSPAAQQPQVPQQQPMQTPMMAAQGMQPVAPAAPPTAAPAATQPPAPVPASQTALGQANTSLAKGGRIDDLSTVDTSQLVKPAEGPSAQDIQSMTLDAQGRQRRDAFGNVIQSDKENYAANLARWYTQQGVQRAEYTKQMDQAGLDNTNINNERSARLAKFYTGTSAANANDIAQRYAPKVTTPAMDWQSAQQALAVQKAAGNVSVRTPGGQMVQVSDENQKQNIATESTSASDSMNPKNFLDKLTAYSYEYKQSQKNNEHAGDGKYLSVMAQDLEKAGPVGQSMVKQDETGVKQVDYGKGFGAILAAQVQLNERLKQIEAKKGKV